MRITTALVLLLCVGLSVSAFAQNLKRRPFLGVQVAPVPDSLAVVHQLPAAAGAWVARVVPNSTAAALKLQPNDIILQVNGKAMSSPSDVVAEARSFTTGDPVSVTVLRNGKKVAAKGKVQPQPYETVANGEVIYDEVALGSNGYARSIIKKPKGKGRFPAVYYIQGYSCGSIDNLPETDPTRRLVDELVARGYAVFRMEKPGAGDSQGTKPCSEVGFHEEVAAFSAGLRELKEYDFVDTSNVFLFGHSLGANVAPLVAARDNVKGIIGYGVNGKPWFEYLIEVFREQRPMTGADYVQVDEDMRHVIPMLYALMIEKKPVDELAQNPRYRAFLENTLDYDGQGHMYGRTYKVLQELQEVEVNKAWRDANTHTLMIYGGADFAAIDPDGANIIVDVVNSYHPGKGTYKFLPGTDHGFVEVGSKEELLKLQQNQQYAAHAQTHFNQKLVEMIHEWMREKMSRT
ncbi:MAG: PDZ domain-containing protein [Hymenobacteraceae bacterium]|nr:PDZ domain-containing protein [Hymenobacteraceae bacterium]